MSETTTTEKSASSVLKVLLGQKLGMTQIFDAQGCIVPVTVVQAGPCHIMQVLTREKHGYSAVQVSFGEVRQKSVNKPDAGQFKKANLQPTRWVREFRTPGPVVLQAGQPIPVDVFAPGDYVDVSGTSKGKGFAGTVKRHNFGGGPKTHGQSDRQRAPGSIGSNTFPGRVLKGMRMAGHLGAEQVTIQHLEVAQVLPDKNLLMIKGAVPGTNRSLIEIRQTLKRIKMKVAHTAHEPVKKEKAAKAPKPAPAAKPKAAKT